MNLDNAVIVAAHPGDEVILFGSLIDKIKNITIVFLKCRHPQYEYTNEGREKLKESHPLGDVSFMGITESLSAEDSDWGNPIETEYGLKCKNTDSKYVQNYHTMVSLFKHKLKTFDTVITHPPWGDYGHEENVQVYRAVKDSVSCDIWFPGYYSDRTKILMDRKIKDQEFQSEPVDVPIDIRLCLDLRTTYLEHHCWTLNPVNEWQHKTDHFYKDGKSENKIDSFKMNRIVL
jgi:hypothetical protein